MSKLLIIAFLVFSAFNTAHSSFGLLLTDRQAADELYRLTFVDHYKVFHSHSSDARTTRELEAKARHKKSKVICHQLKAEDVLTDKQYKYCKKIPEFPHTLVSAYRQMFIQCQRTFRYEPWNCTDDATRMRIAEKDYREKGFLDALTSAALVVSIAKACDSGEMPSCGCSDAYPGGLVCSNSISYAKKTAGRFLRIQKTNMLSKRHSDAITAHNRNLGIKIIQVLLKKECKCHGMSTSCAIKTCWGKNMPMDVVGDYLKNKYINAVKVVDYRTRYNNWRSRTERNSGTDTLQSENSRAVGSLDLVYSEPDINFCTVPWYKVGRECSNSTCSELCCGRGYTSVLVPVAKDCRCKAEWCCQVKCEQCLTHEIKYSCK